MCQVIVEDGSEKGQKTDLTVAGSRKQPTRLNKSLYNYRRIRRNIRQGIAHNIGVQLQLW